MEEIDQAKKDALALMDRVEFVHLSLLDEAGYPEARILFNLRKHRADAMASGPAALPVGSFRSYLGTNSSSRKVEQIRRDTRSCLYFTDTTSFQGLSIRGCLEEVADQDIRSAVYTTAWDMYYPGGRDGGDFSLFLFLPETARYYHGLKVVEFDAAP
jgi:general stress protein 26